MNFIGIFSAVLTTFSEAKRQANEKQMTPEDYAKLADDLEKKYDLFKITGDLSKTVSGFVVEPYILSTVDSRRSPKFVNVAELLTDIFASYYLQAFKVLTIIHGVEARQAIKLLSSKYSDDKYAIHKFLKKNSKTYEEKFGGFVNSMLEGALSKEAYDFTRHIALENNISNTIKDQYISRDNARQSNVVTNIEKQVNKGTGGGSKGSKGLPGIKPGGEEWKNISDHPLHSILYRELQVDLGFDSKIAKDRAGKMDLTVNIMIKAGILNTIYDNIITLVKPYTNDKSFTSRLEEYRSGGISFSEFIFCTDLLKDYKKSRIKDDSDLINKVYDRKKGSVIKYIESNKGMGYVGNYNLLVMTLEEAERVNKVLNLDILKKDTQREEFLDKASALAIVILDDEFERATLMVKGLSGTTSISYKNLDKRGKKSNLSDDYGEIIKSLMTGRQFNI